MAHPQLKQWLIPHLSTAHILGHPAAEEAAAEEAPVLPADAQGSRDAEERPLEGGAEEGAAEEVGGVEDPPVPPVVPAVVPPVVPLDEGVGPEEETGVIEEVAEAGDGEQTKPKQAMPAVQVGDLVASAVPSQHAVGIPQLCPSIRGVIRVEQAGRPGVQEDGVQYILHIDSPMYPHANE